MILELFCKKIVLWLLTLEGFKIQYLNGFIVYNLIFLCNFIFIVINLSCVTFCKTDTPEIHDPLDFLDFWHTCLS